MNTWITTDKVSRTNKPPIIARRISCLHIIAIEPKDPPKAKDPVSPIKTLAGGALNHRKPKAAPIKEPQKTANSPVPGIYWIIK